MLSKILTVLTLIMFASVGFAQAKKQRKTKEKNIIREKSFKSDSKKIDFDATDIGGERKTPFGSMINQNKPTKDYDLIKIRWRWSDELRSSTSSIEAGKDR